jgi:hypothetical protein
MTRTDLHPDDDAQERLVRRHGADVMERLRTLKAIEGLWRDREDIEDTADYVRRLRGGRRTLED